jgi:signal-transduction protein with cAMP-binding, CBS, and nucleotidyltransferase domain
MRSPNSCLTSAVGVDVAEPIVPPLSGRRESNPARLLRVYRAVIGPGFTVGMDFGGRHQHLADHLAAVPMFYTCTSHELNTLAKLTTKLDVPAGKVLITEGKPGQEFMIVLEGTAVATVGGTEVARFGPGDYFGEIALLDPGMRTATVTAETPMLLAVVGRGEFHQMLDDVPPLAHKVMSGLARRLREVTQPAVV